MIGSRKWSDQSFPTVGTVYDRILDFSMHLARDDPYRCQPMAGGPPIRPLARCPDHFGDAGSIHADCLLAEVHCHCSLRGQARSWNRLPIK